MMLTEEQIQTAQGALYLIDHVGAPPKGVNFRLFTNQAIEKHLSRHSYYYYPRNQRSKPAKRTLVTMSWMRKYFFDLYKKANRRFYEPSVAGDDTADRLLRKGSTRGIPDSVLSIYRYDRANFSESDLPPYGGHVDEKTSDSKALETIEEDAVDSRPRRTPAKQTGTTALFQNSDEAYEPTENMDDNGSSEENNDELNDDEDNGSYVDGNDRVEFPSKDSASSTIAPGGFDRAIAGSRESLATESRRSSQSNIEVQTKAKVFHNLVPQNKKNERSNQSKEESSSVSVAAKLGKRKRGDSGHVTQASSTMDEFAIEPTIEPTIEPNERTASSAAVTRGVKARRSSPPQPAAANTSTATSEPRSEAPAPTQSHITPRAKCSNDVQPVEDDVRDSQSTEQEFSGPDLGPQDQSAVVDYNTSNLNNQTLHKKLETATSEIIASIGDIREWASSLDGTPSDRLEALYTRCWGSNWKAVRVRLTKDYVFIALEVTTSLIAAYLFDNVLNQRRSIADIRAKQLELKGSEGRAILRILDLENKEHEFRRVVRAIESEDARAMLAQDHKSTAKQLHGEAQMFTKDLWGIIKPHFRSLSTLARCHGLASGLNERSWQETFETNITELIEDVLRYRLKLLASGRDHVHIWPGTGEAYEREEMEIYGAKIDTPLQVLFTVFPGTISIRPDTTRVTPKQETKAKVKVQKK